MLQDVNWSLNLQCSLCIGMQLYPYISCCTRVLERDILSDSAVYHSHVYNLWPGTEDAKVGCNKHMQATIHVCLASFHNMLFMVPRFFNKKFTNYAS